jgi:hypothetical protein
VVNRVATRVLLPCVVVSLVATGCLELVRRHPDPAETALDNGNPAQVQDVQRTGGEDFVEEPVSALSETDSSAVEETPTAAGSADILAPSSVSTPQSALAEVATESGDEQQESTAAPGQDSAQTQPVIQRTAQTATAPGESGAGPDGGAQGDRPEQSVSDKVASPAEPARIASKSARISRTSGKRGSVKQINEYAFWCVENGLWKEARTHLEHAIEQDLPSASLYNNIGIVYEHFGEEEEALEAYRRAYALNPKQRHYRGNIDLLERRWRAVPDTLGRIEIFDMDQLSTPDSAAVVTPEVVEPSSDEGSDDGNPSLRNGSRRAELDR